MTKKQITERRQRNQQIADTDAQHRCWSCKRELPKAGATFRWLNPDRRFCSQDCLADFEDAKERT